MYSLLGHCSWNISQYIEGTSGVHIRIILYVRIASLKAWGGKRLTFMKKSQNCSKFTIGAKKGPPAVHLFITAKLK